MRMFMFICLILLCMFSDANSAQLKIANNCNYWSTSKMFLKNGDKFQETYAESIGIGPRDIGHYDVTNDSYIEFWDPYIPYFMSDEIKLEFSFQKSFLAISLTVKVPAPTSRCWPVETIEKDVPPV